MHDILRVFCKMIGILFVFAYYVRKQIITNLTNPYFSSHHFIRVFSVHLQALIMQKLKSKYYYKRIKIRDSGNVQSHDQGESKLNSVIKEYRGARTLTDDNFN